MRTTVTVDDELMSDASKASGITERAELIRAGLRALVERDAYRKLAVMGGTMPGLKYIPRRRPEPKD